MRFDKDSTDNTAEKIVHQNDLKELTKIFKEYGEERHAYKIAKRIKELNDKVDVFAITSVVDQVTPFKYRLKTYSRIFQALRIATNDELNHLKFFLDNFIDLLSPQGRIVVISYHSIEDRIVKHKFKDLKNKKKMNLIYKKPLIPSKEEVGLNIYDIKFITNQPWPFPSSLMIGLSAKTKDRKLIIDNNENLLQIDRILQLLIFEIFISKKRCRFVNLCFVFPSLS